METNRIEILRNHIDGVILNMSDTFDRRCAYLHKKKARSESTAFRRYTLSALKRRQKYDIL